MILISDLQKMASNFMGKLFKLTTNFQNSNKLCIITKICAYLKLLKKMDILATSATIKKLNRKLKKWLWQILLNYNLLWIEIQT